VPQLDRAVHTDVSSIAATRRNRHLDGALALLEDTVGCPWSNAPSFLDINRLLLVDGAFHVARALALFEPVLREAVNAFWSIVGLSGGSFMPPASPTKALVTSSSSRM
jgi:hypothetical protein